MSRMNRQIDELIADYVSCTGTELNVDVMFDINFCGFKGHFPENPILPGVVIIQVIKRMYELYTKKNYLLFEIKQAKFIEIVSADTLISFFVQFNSDKDNTNLSGKVLKSGKIISKISLVLKKY